MFGNINDRRDYIWWTASTYRPPQHEENSWEDLGFYEGESAGPLLTMTITVMLPRVIVKSSSSPLLNIHILPLLGLYDLFLVVLICFLIYIVARRSHHCWKKPIVKRRQVLDGIPLSKAEQQQADEKFSGKAGSDHRMQPWGALVSHGFQQLMIWCWGSFCWAPGFLVLKIGGRKSAANLLPKYLQYHRGSFNQVALRYKPVDYVLSISIHNAN